MTKNLFLNKQIILAVGMIVFVVAAVIGGTGAFFSDTESSTGNVFTAGAVDIAITDIAHTPSEPNLVGFTKNLNGVSFSFSDLKPLDKGTVTYTLDNDDNEAFVCALVRETGNDDNGINGPEAAAGDVTAGPGNGELGQFLNFKFGSQSGSLAAISGVWQTVGTILSPGTLPAAIDYCFGTFNGSDCVLGTGNYNLAQTDSLTADVEFYAVQTRNNSGFTCASLNPPVIDGVITAGEWDGATVMNVSGGKGEVKVKEKSGYLYVLFDVLDSTDARIGQNTVGNDQIGFNINPTAGANTWGFPYDIIFQTGADANAWGGASSGLIDSGWKTQWSILSGGVTTQQGTLPAGLESATMYAAGKRITEWKLPLGSVDPTRVGGAIDVGDGNSYTFPVGLDWNNPTTFQAI